MMAKGQSTKSKCGNEANLHQANAVLIHGNGVSGGSKHLTLKALLENHQVPKYENVAPPLTFTIQLTRSPCDAA